MKCKPIAAEDLHSELSYHASGNRGQWALYAMPGRRLGEPFEPLPSVGDSAVSSDMLVVGLSEHHDATYVLERSKTKQAAYTTLKSNKVQHQATGYNWKTAPENQWPSVNHRGGEMRSDRGVGRGHWAMAPSAPFAIVRRPPIANVFYRENVVEGGRPPTTKSSSEKSLQ